MNTKTYAFRMIAFGLLYGLFTIGSALWANSNPNSQLRLVMALVPMIPAFLMLTTYTEHLRSLDELQRNIQLEGLAFAFGTTALLTLSFGFLQAFARLEPPNWVWVWPAMALSWVIGSALAARKYQ